MSPTIHLSRRRFLQAGGSITATALALGSGVVAAQQNSPSTLSTLVRSRHLHAYALRVVAAERMRNTQLVEHPHNGDEERYLTRIGNFSKALPHNHLGEVDEDAYHTLLAAMRGEASCSDIPLGGKVKLANPQAAFAFEIQGMDTHNLPMPAAPAFASEETTAEMCELYWQALTRDLPFARYGEEPILEQAVADLGTFARFRGLGVSTLFRGESAGDQVGPYLSQFLYLPIPYGATHIEQRYRVPIPGDDFLINIDEWLAIQNGVATDKKNSYETTSRYLITGRDLGEYVHLDFTHQAFLNAALILNSFGREALSDANPYKHLTNQGGFVTFGTADVLSLVTGIACTALKAAWVQKWLFHRRLRPEEFGGRVEQQRIGNATYPIHESLFQTQAIAESYRRFGSHLLPIAYPEGSPTHPAYPSGHATIAGACVTILKAFYKQDFEIPAPQVPNDDGTALFKYNGDQPLTVGGELDKLASNIAIGRDTAGVHWRSDGVEGLILGEEVAMSVLADLLPNYPEEFEGFIVARFDGTLVKIGR